MSGLYKNTYRDHNRERATFCITIGVSIWSIFGSASDVISDVTLTFLFLPIMT